MKTKRNGIRAGAAIAIAAASGLVGGLVGGPGASAAVVQGRTYWTECGNIVVTSGGSGWTNLTWGPSPTNSGLRMMNLNGLGWNPARSIGINRTKGIVVDWSCNLGRGKIK